jgi:erythritol transport system permease protein
MSAREQVIPANPQPHRRGFQATASTIGSALMRMRALVALVALVVLFSILAPSFFTANNLSILTRHVAINALLAIGMTFVVISGGIDLSVGSVAGLSGMVAGALITDGIVVAGVSHPWFPGVWFVIAVALAAGAAVGAINGFLVAYFRIAPFIATLGTLYMARGAALLLSGGRTFPELGGDPVRHNNGFPTVGQGHWLGIANPIWIMLILAAAAQILATRSVFGRHVYATGGNERAAILAGIRTGRVRFISYVLSGICAAMAGILIAAQLEAAHPATGESFELTAIAAVVLGGTSLQGGRGSVLGSLAGAFVIGTLADGLVMLGVSEFWQIVIKGLVIVLAVILDQVQSGLHTRLRLAFLRGPQA